jgi:hypothetical protein
LEHGLEHSRQQREQRLPDLFGKGVKPSVEPAFREHTSEVTSFQKETADFDLASKVSRGDQRYGHHFGGRHLGLRIVFKTLSGKEVVA